MDGESCIKKAYEFIFQSDFEQAIYWFEQAIAVDPHNAAYYHKCSVSCARSGKWTKAKIYAEEAEKLDPANDEFRYHSQVVRAQLLLVEANGLLMEKPPRLEDAVDLLQQAVSLDPLSFDACYTIGIVYATMGRLDEATHHAREALRLNPGHSAARRLFADVNRKRRLLRIRDSIR